MTHTILIPGITGTTLVNSNSLDFEQYYSGVQRYVSDMSKLALDANAEFDENPALLIERNHIESIAYKEIYNLVPQIPDAGNIYVFGYDWRRSNAETGKKLLDYISMLKKKLKVSNFNIITHSMGALVLQSCITHNGGKVDFINKAVITVPPFLGAIDALMMITIGKSYLINSAETFRKIARTFPAIFELLPVYDGAFDKFDGDDILNIEAWQENMKDVPNIKVNLDKTAAFRKNTQFDLAKLSPADRKKFLILAGSEEDTYITVYVRDKKPGIPYSVDNYFDFDNKTGSSKKGDGTVPLNSSTHYASDILTLNVKKSFFRNLGAQMFVGLHGTFLNDGRVQSTIKRFFDPKTKFTDSEWWAIVGESISKVNAPVKG